ncbi:dTMP kinase [Acidothermus cellulolyticus]|uniref:dTMP kinase n=1 Tax=Acidothermus cellulolyticus TaxID=28049 RepID=UPI0002E5AA8C|nr:dTMP kinase [Acidothermus cellulolyticus]
MDNTARLGSAVNAVGTSDLRGVLRIPSFRKLWTALAVSSFGDWLGFLGQTALAASLASGHTYLAQNFSVGTVVFVRLLPAVTLAPLAGALADRLDRRLTMVIADIGRFALYASIPIVHTLWWLFVATFLIETLSLFWIPAKEATVPNLVPRERMGDAGSLNLLGAYGTAPIAAAVFALLSLLTGVLARWIPLFTTNRVDLALYFDAVTFLVSAATIFSLREISTHGGRRRTADGVVTHPSVFRSIVDGWRFMGQTPVVRGLAVGMLGAFGAAGVVIGVATIYVRDLGGGGAGYGMLFGAVFLGLAIGMFTGPRVLRGFSRRRLFGLSIAAAGVILAATALVHNLVLVVFGALLLGCCAGIAWVTGYTLLGLEVEDATRGRTWATLQSLMQVDILLMVAAGPFLSGGIGTHVLRIGDVTFPVNGSAMTLLFAGIGALVVGLVAYRQMDDRDVPLWRDFIDAVFGWHPLTGRGVATGFFVAFEGGEGAGKSTQVELLARYLADRGYEVVVSREPGGTPLGHRLREILLDPREPAPSPRAEALLYAADRAEHVAKVIRPALARGAIVISDRYVDSSLAYQGGGRDLSPRDVEQLSRFATSGLRPDLTVLLDVPPDEGLARTGRRDRAPDRLQAEDAAFHERVRNVFRQRAEADPERYLVIDARLSAADIHRLVVQRILPVLPFPPKRAPRDPLPSTAGGTP